MRVVGSRASYACSSTPSNCNTSPGPKVRRVPSPTSICPVVSALIRTPLWSVVDPETMRQPEPIVTNAPIALLPVLVTEGHRVEVEIREEFFDLFLLHALRSVSVGSR